MKKLLTTYWGVLIIVLAWGVFSSPFFIKGLLPFPTKYLVTTFAPWSTTYGMPVKSASMPDVITQIYPWKNLTIEHYKRGTIPLWNPYSFAGTVHAANYQTAVFSPLNLLYVIFSQFNAWSISVLLQPLLAGLFMYVYLSSEKLSYEARVIGSLAFMFCGFIVTWMAYQTLGFAALVLPLCFYAVNISMKEKRWWSYPLLSVSIWFSLVSGHFQTSLYVLLATVFYLGYTVIFTKKYLRGTVLCLFILFGILLSSPQLFITYEAYGESIRSTLFGKGEIIPWSYLITFFAPDFYGNPVTRNDWFGHYAEWAGFLGVIPLLLACISLKSNNKHTWFFIGLSLLTLLFATPTVLTDLMYKAHIPVLSTSSASRIILLTSFSLSVLSGFGLDALRVLWEKREKSTIVAFVFGIGVFLILFWIVLWFLKPFPMDKVIIAMRNSLLSSVMLFVFGALIYVGQFVAKKKQVWIIWIFMFITAIDVLRFAGKWMPFEPKEYLYPPMEVTRKLNTILPNTAFRVAGNYGNELGGMYHVPSLEGYDAMYKRRYGEFIEYLTNERINEPQRSVVLLNKHGLLTQKALDLLGVKYYLHKVSDGRYPWAYPYWKFPQYHSIWKDDTYELFENTGALERAFLASSYTVVPQALEQLQTVFSPTINMRETLVLEEKPLGEPAVGSGSANIVVYTSEEVIIKTKSDVPKLLFLSDVYDDGWNAMIDGVKAPVYRAHYTFRAVSLNPGEHTVVFRYHPESFRWGIIVCFVSLFFLTIGSLLIYTYEHRFL